MDGLEFRQEAKLSLG